MMIDYAARMIWRWRERRFAWTPTAERLVRSADVWASVPRTLEVEVQAALGIGPDGWSVGTRSPFHRPRASRWRIYAPSSVAAAAATLVLLATGYLAQAEADATRTAALSGPANSSTPAAWADLRNKPSGVEITLRSATLHPAPAGKYYEGWVKGARGTVSIGTFHLRHQSEKVVLWSGVDLDEYPTIAVTLESEDDDPASSEQVIASGAVSPTDR
ncbi:anti-sigma factor [Kribbella sindirgiensis]|nr:anti-sigma factor [Kribbella sindirgiensis]